MWYVNSRTPEYLHTCGVYCEEHIHRFLCAVDVCVITYWRRNGVLVVVRPLGAEPRRLFYCGSELDQNSSARKLRHALLKAVPC